MANKKLILLVDDEPEFVEIISARLRLKGYTVITASGGKEGIEKARKEKPDLMLLDIMMPALDGGEVAQILGDRMGAACPPIIYLTALVSGKEAARRNQVGADEIILPKTMDFDTILATVQNVLAERNV